VNANVTQESAQQPKVIRQFCRET